MCLAAVSTAAGAGDRPDPSSGWPAEWKRVGLEEAIAVGGLASSSILLRLFLNAPEQPRWDSPILFDESARDALRTSLESARSRAGDFSNAAYALGAFPLVVDAGLVTRIVPVRPIRETPPSSAVTLRWPSPGRFPPFIFARPVRRPPA